MQPRRAARADESIMLLEQKTCGLDSCPRTKSTASWTKPGGRAEFAPSRSAWLAALDDVRKVQAWSFDARYVALLETIAHLRPLTY